MNHTKDIFLVSKKFIFWHPFPSRARRVKFIYVIYRCVTILFLLIYTAGNKKFPFKKVSIFVVQKEFIIAVLSLKNENKTFYTFIPRLHLKPCSILHVLPVHNGNLLHIYAKDNNKLLWHVTSFNGLHASLLHTMFFYYWFNQ